mmetsp:Transcript_24365/g.37741  ORF Transcript_24365/g.37741 Transcript_24365/m.37741 type:complete len:212 (+) Transcript_24365:1170-1805(+)
MEAEKDLEAFKIIDFTNDNHPADGIGHGTFISGVVGSRNKYCPGIAPDAELYIFKLFSEKMESYTEWFLNAFNYVLDHDIDIVNLSNGSTDFLDEPFNDKINELIAKGVVVVSAVGNEGPFQGTVNNPADLIDVIGVGSLNDKGDNVAFFSSRGMTTNKLLDGYGIMKPDILTFGENIKSLSIEDSPTCTLSSGTSVSSSVITGSIALALS